VPSKRIIGGHLLKLCKS